MSELVCAADDPRWLTERRKGITATDITAIVGLSPYESAYSLFFKKRGDIPDEHTDNDRMRLGRELEPIILARWAEQAGEALYGWRAQLYRSTARPWQLATPDSVLWSDDKKDGDPAAVLEVKSWADADRWTDGPPARVRAQVLWQMDTLDVATGHVGVLFLPSGEFRSYVIQHQCSTNPLCEACEDLEILRDAGRDFMDRLCSNEPPSPDASTATLAALKARFSDPQPGKEAEIDGDHYMAWISFKHAADQQAEQAKHYENLIREQAGEAHTLTVNGIPVARHTVSIVKAHTRNESTRDSITRIRDGATDE